MYKIIIADDNPLIRMGMKSMIRFKEMKAELVGEAADGNEVLEILKAVRADLLITDIRMPGKDGLYLIHEVQNNYPEMNTIIISAYHEFSYAKEAIRAGSVDYILKPINPEELNAAIQKAITYKKEREVQAYGREMGAIPSLILLRISEAEGEQELWKLFEAYPDVHIQKKEQSFILSFDGSVVSMERICHILEMKFKQEYLYGTAASSENVIFEELLAKAKKDAGRCFLRKAKDDGKNRTIGKLSDSIKDIAVLCKSGNPESAKQLCEQKLQEILYSCGEDLSLWEKSMQRFLGELLKLDVNMVCGMSEILKKAGNQEEALSYVSFKELEQELKDSIERLCAVYMIQRGSRTELVSSVQEWIENSYEEKISLAGIASDFHVSAPYLSKIFKEETGCNLNQYITDVRIEKAKDLLHNSNKKIAEIAELTGYEDVNYFIKVYKKNTGKTPTQDRM